MMEMTVEEMAQVSGGGGRGGIGGDVRSLLGNGSDGGASVLGQTPEVSMGSSGAAGLPTTLGGRGGISGDF